MLKLSILIVENDKYDLKEITSLLLRKELEISASFELAESYQQALNVFARGLKFDLSILDVDLGAGQTSFKLLEQFRENLGEVVYMTNAAIPARYVKLALPLEHIEKPFEFEDVVNVISKLRKKKGLQPRRLFIDDKSQVTYMIGEDQIYYMETAKKGNNPKNLVGDKCIIHFLDKKSNEPRQIYSLRGLSDFSKVLSPESFVKCNGACLVNIHKVIGLDTEEKELILDDERFGSISISETFRAKFKERLTRF